MPETGLRDVLAQEDTQADVLTNLQNAATSLQNILDSLTGTLEVDSAPLGLQLDTLAASLTAILEVEGSRATSAKQDTAQTELESIAAALTAIDGHVDGLEGFTDSVEGLLTTLGGYVDGLEANTANLAKTDVATTLTDGRKTVTTPGTAVAIRATLACKWVTGNALFSNTQQVNIGGSGVLAAAGSSTGRGLQPGDSFSYPVADAAELFIDARVAGEGVSFTVGS